MTLRTHRDEKADAPVVLVKWYDWTKWLLERVDSFPKNQRFIFGQRLAKGRCQHEDCRCQGNVPFMEGLTLCALARYRRITKDPEVLRAISVGIDQMIRECWQQDVKNFRYTA